MCFSKAFVIVLVIFVCLQQMRTAWTLNTISPQHSIQHIPHLGISTHVVTTPQSGAGGGSAGSVVMSPAQQQPPQQQQHPQQMTNPVQIQDERRRAVAEHVEREREREQRDREKERELDRIRQQEDNRRSYYVAAAAASAGVSKVYVCQGESRIRRGIRRNRTWW